MRTFFVAIIAATLAGTAVAQTTCKAGQPVPDFGYGFASCDNCLSSVVQGGLPVPHFSGQPTLHQIRTDGPGTGVLIEGDTLVSVDGLPITTEAAATRLATYRSGATKLTLRRNGFERTVSITPKFVCVRMAQSQAEVAHDLMQQERERVAEVRYKIGAIGRPEYERVMGHYELADSLARMELTQAYNVGRLSRENYERAMGHYTTADSLVKENARRQMEAGMLGKYEYRDILAQWVADSTRRQQWGAGRDSGATGYGNMGWTIECGSCKMLNPSQAEFARFPVLDRVGPGTIPAQLGMRAGDVLLAINDIAMTAPGAGQRLIDLPQESFRVTWSRNGVNYSASWPLVPSGQRADHPKFSRHVNNVQIDVNGPGRAYVRNKPNGEIEVRMDSVTVTIRPAAKDSSRQR